MSSTYKFPKGLNNWVESDKPMRTDFVADNEILDENAMWREDYDADGAVMEAGGIAEYAMDRASYDANGTVASAGGIAEAIATAVSEVEGFSTYTHSKSGSTHGLVNENGGPNIKFIATGDYAEDDTFSVNGTSCDAQTNDGEPLAEDSFKAGALVTCFQNGTTLNFKTGGAGFNFKVITSTSQPTSPKENTIWINTDIQNPNPGNAIFYPTTPGGGFQGRVWIQVGTASSTPINTVKTPLIEGFSKWEVWEYPIAVSIMNNGAWQNVSAVTKVYQGGSWKPITTVMQEQGIGWNTTQFPYSKWGTATNAAAALSLGVSSGITVASGYLNFSLYKTIKYQIMKSGAANYDDGVYIGVSDNLTSNTTVGYITNKRYLSPTGWISDSIDVSSITGNHGFKFMSIGTTTSPAGAVRNITLEG